MASRAGRRRARLDHRARRVETPLGGTQRTESRGGRAWVVRQVTGAASAKDYRCPGCAQLVRAGTPHVVVWPVEASAPTRSGLDERRHWHTSCWSRGLLPGP